MNVRMAALAIGLIVLGTTPACGKRSSTGSSEGAASKKCVPFFTTCSCSYRCEVEVEGARPADCATVCNPDAAAPAAPMIKCAWQGSTCAQVP